MIRIAPRVLLLIALMASAVAISWPQAAARGTVTGSVTGASGPVAGVKVVITSAVSAYTENTTTDQTGTFTFSGAPLGGVTVMAVDSRGRTLASATGKLDTAGEVVTLSLKIS